MNRATGIIVHWNVEKSFGFAKRPFGADIYVHQRCLMTGAISASGRAVLFSN
jgi:cold shock CspA family protein